MCGPPPPPPAGEPEAREIPPSPAVVAGIVWHSVLDWYERQRNRFEFLQGSRYERTLGDQVRVGMNVMSDLVYGWSHATVVGVSLGQIIGFDNKANVGFVLNFIRKEKTENTKGIKDERLLAGLKLSHVIGTKKKLVGADEIDVSDIDKKAVKIVDQEHYTAVDKLVTDVFEQEVKDLLEQHQTLDAEIKKMNQQIDKCKETSDKYVEKYNVFKAEFQQAREECESVHETTSGKLQLISDAAVEFRAGGELKGTAGKDANFTADSLISFAAAITKLG